MKIIVISCLAALAESACVVNVATYTFDFSSVEGKQVSSKGPDDSTVSLSFCSSMPCGFDQASICLVGSGGQNTDNLGPWPDSDKWSTGGPGEVTGVFYGSSTWCPGGSPRKTTVRFKCSGTAEPYIEEFTEPDACVYALTVVVPQLVCALPTNCCTPPTYSMVKFTNTSGISPLVGVVQQDEELGNVFDHSGPITHLCVESANRCWDYNETWCAGSAYKFPSPTCIGISTGWNSFGAYPVGDGGPAQIVWNKRGQLALTAMVDGVSCVILNPTPGVFVLNISSSTDPSLWQVPPQCLKGVKRG